MRLIRFIEWYRKIKRLRTKSNHPINKAHVRKVAWVMSNQKNHNEKDDDNNNNNTALF